MKRMMFLWLVAFVSTAFGQDTASKSSSSSKASEEKWIQLFNGKDLEGWIPKIRYHELGENYANTFRSRMGS